MPNYYEQLAKKIPLTVKKAIIQEKYIDIAVNNDRRNTPMELLFDVYEEYLDTRGEHDDWNCPKCREFILQQWKKLKPYLQSSLELNSTQ